MRNAKRGRKPRHGSCFCAVAALGFALSGCGGGTGGSSPAAAATSAPATTQSGTSPGTTGSTSGDGTSTSSSGGAVTINWTPPTENTNGTPLTNLAGYNIHYGTSSANLTQTITVSNPGIATYVVTNLTQGKYYFAVAAVNTSGTESPLSAQVSATVTN